MDEIREEVCRLKREELKARLKGLPFTPTDEEKSLLEKWEAKMSISADDTSIIIPPTGGMAEYINNYVQNNILDTKEESIVLSSHDMLKKKRDELRQKGGFGTRDKQIMKPQGAFTYRTVREQWILNENVKVLFENESLLKVYQGVNIPDEMGQNMDDFDGILKQKREELRKLLLSNKKVPLINNEDDFSTIVIPRGGALYIDEDKCEKDYQKNFQVKEEQTRKTTT